MAMIETWFEQDITKPVMVHFLGGNVFAQDNNGNLVGVKVYNNGESVQLSGSVMGYCILATGASVPVAGTISGNGAYIIIPEAAYAVPGAMNIIIKNIVGATVTTLAAISTSVIGLGAAIGDPTAETIASWTAQINATIATLEANTVRFDTAQSLTAAQKAQAQANIGAGYSAVNISDDKYKIVIP